MKPLTKNDRRHLRAVQAAYTAETLAYGCAIQEGYTRAEFKAALSKRRGFPHMERRVKLMRFLRDMGYSTLVIGAVFGRDHSTVVNALRAK